MKVGLALRDLHAAEGELARELVHVAERHKADHEIYHVGRDVAAWSVRHVREIADAARPFGEDLDPETDVGGGVAALVREKGSELVGRSSAPGLLLLRDLRSVYVLATGVAADWEMVSQAAKGLKDAELLAVVQRCQAETQRQVAWAKGKLKESSTQVLVS